MFYWLRDPAQRARFKAALKIVVDTYRPFGPVFASDMLVVMGKQVAFASDPRIKAAFDDIRAGTEERALIWRLHTLIWAAEHCRHLDGDFVECGVFRAFSTAVVARAIDFNAVGKDWYLYDAWTDGARNPALNDQARQVYADPEPKRVALERCAPFPRVKFIQGNVPEVFAQALPGRVAFLHIDMNGAEPEIAALDVLFDRMTPGGILVYDDYAWRGNYADQGPAHDRYMAKRGYTIMELPTGQGMVIKR